MGNIKEIRNMSSDVVQGNSAYQIQKEKSWQANCHTNQLLSDSRGVGNDGTEQYHRWNYGGALMPYSHGKIGGRDNGAIYHNIGAQKSQYPSCESGSEFQKGTKCIAIYQHRVPTQPYPQTEHEEQAGTYGNPVASDKVLYCCHFTRSACVCIHECLPGCHYTTLAEDRTPQTGMVRGVNVLYLIYMRF